MLRSGQAEECGRPKIHPRARVTPDVSGGRRSPRLRPLKVSKPQKKRGGGAAASVRHRWNNEAAFVEFTRRLNPWTRTWTRALPVHSPRPWSWPPPAPPPPHVSICPRLALASVWPHKRGLKKERGVCDGRQKQLVNSIVPGNRCIF